MPASIAAENASPREKAAQLRALSDAELLALAEQAGKTDHWLDVARRGQAEFENTLKRLRRDRQDASKFASSALARELLPVIDRLAPGGRAALARFAEQAADLDAFLHSVVAEMTPGIVLSEAEGTIQLGADRLATLPPAVSRHLLLAAA